MLGIINIVEGKTDLGKIYLERYAATKDISVFNNEYYPRLIATMLNQYKPRKYSHKYYWHLITEKLIREDPNNNNLISILKNTSSLLDEFPDSYYPSSTEYIESLNNLFNIEISENGLVVPSQDNLEKYILALIGNHEAPEADSHEGKGLYFYVGVEDQKSSKTIASNIDIALKHFESTYNDPEKLSKLYYHSAVAFLNMWDNLSHKNYEELRIKIKVYLNNSFYMATTPELKYYKDASAFLLTRTDLRKK